MPTLITQLSQLNNIDELEYIKFSDALALVIKLHKAALKKCLSLDEQGISDLMDYFTSLLPNYFNVNLGIFICES